MDANTTWHKKLANVNVGIFLQTEECEGGLTYVQGNPMCRVILCAG